MISGRDIQIEVDGGVNLDNVKQVKEAGADLIVVGGALFNKQPHESYQALKSLFSDHNLKILHPAK